MPPKPLGLYDLLAPHFLAGVDFPDYIDKYLSFLNIENLRTASDENAIVYRGTAVFSERDGVLPEFRHRAPSGAIFDWKDIEVRFRLTVPRDGSDAIGDAVSDLAGSTFPGGVSFTDLDDLLNTFGAVNQDTTDVIPSEYPGFRFRLELQLSLLEIHLSGWRPAKVINGRIFEDQDAESKDVKIVLPKIIFQYEKDDRFLQGHRFEVKSWGNSGFDAPADLRGGEVIRMEPAIAISKNGKYGFGLDQILLDLSKDSTPPEILEFFGTDESFQGVFIKNVRFFYTRGDNDFAFGIGIKDMLINFAGEVSFDASVDFFGTTFGKDDVELYFFDRDGVEKEYEKGKESIQPKLTEVKGSKAVIPRDGKLQVVVQGGSPPYVTNIEYREELVNTGGENTWDLHAFYDAENEFTEEDKEGILKVEVRDNTGETFKETVALRLEAETKKKTKNDGTEEDKPPEENKIKPINPLEITFKNPDPLPTNGYRITAEAISGSTQVKLRALGGGAVPNITITENGENSTPQVGEDRSFKIDLKHGESVEIEAFYPGGTSSFDQSHLLLFKIGYPHNAEEINKYVKNALPPDASGHFSNEALRGMDPIFIDNGGGRRLIQFLLNELADNQGSSILVGLLGQASIEGESGDNDQLSQRRLEVAKQIIEQSVELNGRVSFTELNAVGEVNAQNASNDEATQQQFRSVTITGSLDEQEVTIKALLSRPNQDDDDDDDNGAKEPVKKPDNTKPSFIRRLGMRFKLERNVPSLIELYGEFDFETELEEKLRSKANENPDTSVGDQTLRKKNEGDTDPGDCDFSGPPNGIIAFKIHVTHDTATHTWEENLFVGANPDSREGLLNFNCARIQGGSPRLKDMLGALLVFAPIVSEVGDELDARSAGDWVKLGLAIGIPVTLGAFKVINISQMTLYGIELKSRQTMPPDGDSKFGSAGIMFDYGTRFHIDVLPNSNDPLLRTTKPVGVRYKGIGVQLIRNPETGEYDVDPIFDTTKGYEIDLSDPGLLDLKDPLGNLLSILGARISKVNPLLLELDMGLKMDLGIFEVDKFKVKWELPTSSDDPIKAPVITPTGIKVDLNQVLVGSGYLKIEDKIENGENLGKAIRGGMDITLVSIKLRMAAEVSVEPVQDPNSVRKATAVYASILVEFPSPIVLGSTGLGIFGVTGLFAMHYKRIEEERQIGEVVGPALKWLKAAGGMPNRFEHDGVTLWDAELDRWSFGVGILMGTLEGGTLINFWGTFVLELPGPRILIFVKVKIISQLPNTADENEANQLLTGILGVVDLDFNLRQLTIGVIIDLDIKEIIQISLPIEIFFDFDNSRNFHLYMGTHKQMAGARILNLVNAYGYFMIEGNEIVDYPPGTGRNFPGVAVATGLEAAIILGDTDIGLYLKIAIGAHMAISFIPQFGVAGQIFLEGELHLFVLGIGAKGVFDVIYIRKSEEEQETFIKGEVCGKICFFFFCLEGCVGFKRGNAIEDTSVPSLIKNVYLQSFSPVIASGQGSDKPIDASLGDAATTADQDMPEVPIDSNIVLQFIAPPVVGTQDGATTQVFGVDFAKPAPNFIEHTNNGWVSISSGREAKFILRSVTINENFDLENLPPVTWRKDNLVRIGGEDADPQLNNKRSDTSVDLALMSRVPFTAERALERSSELNELVLLQWDNLCTPEAKPACVFFDFCKQPLGLSGNGWRITGTPWPDPPGTKRSKPHVTSMYVEEPEKLPGREALDSLGPSAAGLEFKPAIIIGQDGIFSDDDIPRDCLKGVELPNVFKYKEALAPELEVSEELEQHFNFRRLQGYLDFHTKPCTLVRILFAVTKVSRADHSPGNTPLVIYELDKDKGALENHVLFDGTHNVVKIDSVNLLPDTWTDSEGPWARTIEQFLQFWALELRGEFDLYYYELKPLKETAALRIWQLDLSGILQDFRKIRTIIGGVEVCHRSEIERVKSVEALKLNALKTITDFVGNSSGKTVDEMLQPDTDYTLEVEYDVLIRKEGDSSDPGQPAGEDPIKEQFFFRTTNQLPERLDPYILGTTPNDADHYHFYEDPVKIIFNDETIIELVKAHSAQLQISLTSADGLPVTDGDEFTLNLEEGDANFISPYRDLLVFLLENDLIDCFGGNVLRKIPRIWKLRAVLKPLVDYILEIKYDPPTGNDGSDPDKPVTPLFRRNFRTSRFPSPEALATDIRSFPFRYHALSKQLNLSFTPDVTDHFWIEDIEMERILVEAGEQRLPPVSQSGVRLYWVPNPGNEEYYLKAIMIDGAEPIWRERLEADLKSVDSDPPDPNFQIVIPGKKISLRIRETDTAHVDYYLISHGGTRVLSVLKDDTIGLENVDLKLQLIQPASPLYGLDEKICELIAIPITKAPWAEDDE